MFLNLPLSYLITSSHILFTLYQQHSFNTIFSLSTSIHINTLSICRLFPSSTLQLSGSTLKCSSHHRPHLCPFYHWHNQRHQIIITSGCSCEYSYPHLQSRQCTRGFSKCYRASHTKVIGIGFGYGTIGRVSDFVYYHGNYHNVDCFCSHVSQIHIHTDPFVQLLHAFCQISFVNASTYFSVRFISEHTLSQLIAQFPSQHTLSIHYSMPLLTNSHTIIGGYRIVDCPIK